MKSFSNIVVITGVILYAALSVRAETLNRQLSHDVDAGVLTRADAVYIEVMRSLGSKEVPTTYQETPLQVYKCGFGLQEKLMPVWQNLSGSQRDALQKVLYRPDLDTFIISPGGYFKIHYDTTGAGAPVPYADLDGNDVPDYIDATAMIADSVHNMEVFTLGLQSPPLYPASQIYYDIYIHNIPGVYGWTHQDTHLGNDRWTSYMRLDNNYAHTETKGLDGLRVTMAHEYYHAIQLGYIARGLYQSNHFDDQFLMEAMSTWMEDVVYDDINDYYYYLDNFFENPNSRFDRTDTRHEYGLSIYIHFLEERFPNLSQADIAVEIWEALVDQPAIPTLDIVLRNWGSSFERELMYFSAWNVMTGEEADTLNFYPEGNHYPQMYLDGSFSFSGDTTFYGYLSPTAPGYYRATLPGNDNVYVIPVNLDSYEKSNSAQFTVEMNAGTQWPGFTHITSGLQVRILGDGVEFWNAAVVLKSGSAIPEITVLEATPGGDAVSLDSLPSGYPNPYRLQNDPMVTLPFKLHIDDLITLKIFTVTGYLVYKQEKYFSGGAIGEDNIAEFFWNGCNNAGERVASGMYIYVMYSGSHVFRKNLISVIR